MRHGDAPSDPDAFGAGRVLELIRDRDTTTRAELVRETGLSRSTLAKRVQDLLQLDLVREVEGHASTGGRPPATLVFNREAGYVLAADIGVARTRAAACDLAGEPRVERMVPMGVGSGPAEAVLRAVRRCFEELLAAEGADVGVVRGVGVGLAPGWEGVSLAGRLGPADAIPALVESQVNTMALGEHRTHWRDAEHLLFVEMGATVRCGIVSGRRIHRGAQGSAGDIAHVRIPGHDHVVCRCGSTGCLDAVAGGAALAARLGVADTVAVTALVQAGEPRAVQALREAGRALGAVLALCINFYNPGAIVIGGELAETHQHLLVGAHEVAFARSPPMATRDLKLHPSRLGDRAGLVGAATMVADHLLAPERVDAMAVG